MFKRNNPGCTNSAACRCSGSACDCEATQLRVDLTSNDLLTMICGTVVLGGPCSPTSFTFDITGTYYIPLTMSPGVTELFFHNLEGLQACGDPPLPDTKFCILVRVAFGTENCQVAYGMWVYLFTNTNGSTGPCPSWNDIPDIINGEPEWSGWSASVISPLSTGLGVYRNWCNSYDDPPRSFHTGDQGDCLATALTIAVEMYPSA